MMILGKLHTVKYNADNHGQKQLRPEERPVSSNACNISMSYVKKIKRERECDARAGQLLFYCRTAYSI